MITKGEERRERRAKKRKAEIIESAAKVFAAKGYVKATTKDIADGADVAEGTIYQYFKSKRDLLIELLKRNTDQSKMMLSHMPPLDSANAKEDLIRVLTIQLHVIKSQSFSTLFAGEALRDKEIHDIFYNHFLEPMIAMTQKRIAKGIEIGISRPVDERIAAQLINALMIGFDVILNSNSDAYLDSLDPDYIGKSIGEILFYGLAVENKTVSNNK